MVTYLLVFFAATGFVSGLLVGLVYAICRLFGWIVFSSEYWERLAFYREYDEGTGNWKLGLHFAAPLATFLLVAVWIAFAVVVFALAPSEPTDAEGFLIGLLVGFALAVMSLIAGRHKVLTVNHRKFLDIFPAPAPVTRQNPASR